MHTHGVNIAAIRKDYQLAALDEQSVGDDPLLFFGKWLAEAEAAQIGEVNAMTIATVDAQSKPHARIVLLKGLDESGFVFFTNYQSAKGRQLAVHPFATLVFFWKELERQVRIDGRIEKLSDHENDAYFQSRPEGSRIGAWASPQSQLIANRNLLEENYAAFSQKFIQQQIFCCYGASEVTPSTGLMFFNRWIQYLNYFPNNTGWRGPCEARRPGP